MASVFLSYSREDVDRIRSLARALEGAGHDVWWDRRIAGGEEFSGAIEEALESAQVVVVANGSPITELDMVDSVADVARIDRSACRQRVERYFSPTVMAQGYERLYANVLAENSGDDVQVLPGQFHSTPSEIAF